ncbi:LacI family DNA-binding transcriptional regulator [Ruania alba]|uniref:DNA-binding transcriptional regulator, LacI/PurR family n=1 Tax=Ruania alba TaxID=648782 RepID=A0A1H5HSC6_9MICO|nr:LacI family DNA-binding transcriptional regulator [Ruania alba]SEE30819.1 DNA-binding transcriptional regulator, LacI/PurR family [Ruania alba]
MVTMKDVAEHAGVSIATVSFVVNDTKPVTPATRARIEAAMVELGYRRNAVARALASRRTRILALVYPVFERPLNTSSVEFFTSAAAAASARGYHLVIWPVSNDGRELGELLGQRLVDGVLLMEVQLDDSRVQVLERSGTPFALIGRTREPDRYRYVDIDFEATVAGAVDHLAALGHQHLTLVLGSGVDHGDRDYGPFARTRAAFDALLPERTLTGRTIEVNQTEDATALADRIVASHPAATGILVLNDHTALRLVAGLRRTGRKVPGDISVMGLLAAAESGMVCDPPLTLMRAPGPELGRLGADALIRDLEKDEPLPPRLVPCAFEPGQSTAPRRSS